MEGLSSEAAGIGDAKAGASVGVEGWGVPWSFRLGLRPPDFAAAAMEGGVALMAPTEASAGGWGGSRSWGMSGCGDRSGRRRRDRSGRGGFDGRGGRSWRGRLGRQGKLGLGCGLGAGGGTGGVAHVGGRG